MLRIESIPRLLVAALLCVSLQAAAESAAEYFEAAIVRFDNKEYRPSAILLKNALREDPAHLPSRILLGKSLLHLGDVAGAEKNLQIALEYGADESQVIALLGSAYLVQGKYETLLAEIRSGGRPDEVEMQILVLRAYANLQLGRLDRAKKNLRRARRLQPEHAGPMLALATVAIREGALDEAERLVDLAQRHQPDTADILFARGELARLRGDTERAIVLLSQSLEQSPAKVQARLSRAALLLKSGRDEAARADIDYVRERSPNNLQATYLNAMLLARAGKYKQASSALQGISQTLSTANSQFLNNHGPTILLLGTLDYLQNDLERAKSRLRRYVELEPNHLQPRLLLAETLIRMEDSLGAILALEPMLTLHPDNVDLLLLLGTAQLHEENYDEAHKYLDRAAALKPDLTSVRARLALSNLGLGDTRSAMQNLAQVVDMADSPPAAGLLLANMQLREHRYDQALATLDKLRGKMPDNPLLFNLSGLAWLGKKDPEQAWSAFTAALELEPEFVPARLNLAAVEAGRQAYAAAGEHYDQVLRRSPEDVRAMEGMAKLAELSNRPDEAISWLEKIRNLESTSASEAVLTHLAELYLAARRPEQALPVAHELGQRRPGELTELDLKGRAYLQMNEHAKAARLFRIMHQSKPESAVTLQRIAALLLQAGDLQGAARAVEEALAKDPGLLPAKGTRILVNQRLGNLELALNQARQLAQEHPQLAIGRRLGGDIQMQLGNYQAAAAAYSAGLEVEPGTELLLLWFRAKNAAGDGERARTSLHRWLDSHPNDIPVHEILAAIYARAGALERARSHYERLVMLQPERASAYNNLAILYHRMGLPEALDTAQKAHRLNPDDAAVNDTLGWILVQQGRHEQGLGYLRQAHAREARNPEVRYHLAVALHGLGRNQEAARELQAALATGNTFNGKGQAAALLRQIDIE